MLNTSEKLAEYLETIPVLSEDATDDAFMFHASAIGWLCAQIDKRDERIADLEKRLNLVEGKLASRGV